MTTPNSKKTVYYGLNTKQYSTLSIMDSIQNNIQQFTDVGLKILLRNPMAANTLVGILDKKAHSLLLPQAKARFSQEKSSNI